MLFTSAAVGSISQILFLGLRPSSPIWATVAILSIVGNVAFGLGNVCLNAYLPALARNAPSSSSLDSLEEDDQPQHRQAVAISRASSYISSLGIGTGYTVGIGALLLCLIPVLILHGSIDSMRIAIASSGATWALLSVPAFYLLHSTSTRPQQPVSLTAGWVGMHHMFSEAKQLRQTMQYLLAYIFLSDAFATVMSTATLFAKTVVHMPPQNLILVGVLAPCSGVMGAFMVPMIASSVGATNLQTLLSLCLLASIGPAYGCLALFFNIEPGHIGSLSTHAEIYGFAMLFGMFCFHQR